MSRPSNEPVQSSRAEQRKLKLQEIEREQQAEEMEALKITEEQLRLLKAPFLSVKFEFSDLDGLHWTKSSLYSRQHRSPVAWHNDTSFTSPAPAVITRADLARLSPEETIRLPRKQAYSSMPKFAGTAASLGLASNYRQKERSPVKGLFQDLDLNTAREYTVLSNYSPDIPYEDVTQDIAYHNINGPLRLSTSASQQARESAWLVGAFLASSAYGVVLALFVLNFYLLLRRVRSDFPHYGRKRNTAVIVLLVFITVEFLSATLTMVSHVAKSRLAFVVHRDDYPGGPATYQEKTLGEPMSTLGIASTLLINWSSDGLLLWRCMAFYKSAYFRGSKAIFAVPCIMYILSIGTGITINVLLVRRATSALSTLIILYGSLAVGLNVLLTLMIIIRLSLLRRKIARTLGTARMSQYTSIIAMLVESASIFVFAVLLYIIPLGLRSVVAVVPMIVMNMVQVISSFMIIYRVAQGTTNLDAHDDMSRIIGQDIGNAGVASRGRVSVIRFAIPSGVSISCEEGLGCDVVEGEKAIRRPRDDSDSGRRSSEEVMESWQEKDVSDIRSGQTRQNAAHSL
ncbi:hypothetical protein H1R20_g15635, partial [Candolleomyces eurysporus]